jgi:hypothetical protein
MKVKALCLCLILKIGICRGLVSDYSTHTFHILSLVIMKLNFCSAAVTEGNISDFVTDQREFS